MTWHEQVQQWLWQKADQYHATAFGNVLAEKMNSLAFNADTPRQMVKGLVILIHEVEDLDPEGFDEIIDLLLRED
jgi:hypothetical protein